MAGILDGLKKAFTTNPLKQAEQTGDTPPPAYTAPTEDPAATAARNTQAVNDKAAATERARKKRADASRMSADGVANQLRNAVQ